MFLNLFKKINPKKPGLLVVGHDLKFLTPVINHIAGNNDTKIELFSYPGHVVQNKNKLLKMLPEYKFIFCEWGLGNIRFLSENKKANQKLIVRIHSQEFRTNFLQETKWEHVDAMIFISQYQLERFIHLFPDQAHKCKLIYNLMDCNNLAREKNKDASFTLGMLGILPKSKAPLIGLEILHELKKHDKRFKISIKSKRPEELEWLWRNSEEREYYERFYAMIESMNMKDSVIFEPHGHDVPEWFQQIGFVLSTSEFEGSHQSVAEGMAAGSIPVIRNWDGAYPLYPEKYIFNEVKEAVELVLKHSNINDFQHESDVVKKYAQAHFDLSVILPKYDRLINSLSD